VYKLMWWEQFYTNVIYDAGNIPGDILWQIMEICCGSARYNAM